MKITKRLINKSGLVLSPGWVSNGHWLVRRSRVGNNALLADLATARAAGLASDHYGNQEVDTDDHAERITTPCRHHVKSAVRFRSTGWTRKDGGEAWSSDGGALVLLNADYAAALASLGDLLMVPECSDRLFVAGEDGEVDAIVMPMTPPAPGVRFDLGTWLDFRAAGAEQRVALLSGGVTP